MISDLFCKQSVWISAQPALIVTVGIVVFIIDPMPLFVSLFSWVSGDPWASLFAISFIAWFGIPWNVYHAVAFFWTLKCAHKKSDAAGDFFLDQRRFIQVLSTQWALIIVQFALSRFPQFNISALYNLSLRSGAGIAYLGTIIYALLVLAYYGTWAAQFGLGGDLARNGIRRHQRTTT